MSGSALPWGIEPRPPDRLLTTDPIGDAGNDHRALYGGLMSNELSNDLSMKLFHRALLRRLVGPESE